MKPNKMNQDLITSSRTNKFVRATRSKNCSVSSLEYYNSIKNITKAQRKIMPCKLISLCSRHIYNLRTLLKSKQDHKKTINFVQFILLVKPVFLLFGVLLSWITCCEVNAQGNIHLGPLKINPLFSISERYDDNILDTPRDEISDLITMYSPGLSLSLPVNAIKSELNVSYLVNINDYRQNNDQDTINHYFDISLNTRLPRGFGLVLKERFEDTDQPPYYDLIYGEIFQRIKRQTNTFSANVSFPQYLTKLKPSLSYLNTTTTYEGLEASDYHQQQIGTQFTYKLFTKIDAFTTFNAGETSINDNPYSVFYESLVGIQFEETAKTTGVFKIGYRISDYKDEDFKPFKGVVLSLESRTKLTDLTSFSVLLRRSQEEALITRDSNFYELNAVYLTLERKLTRKVTASISNYYQILNFPAISSEDTSEREDFVLGFNASLQYKIQKWLSASLGYWYENRDSSEDNFGRKKNVITFTIGAAF